MSWAKCVYWIYCILIEDKFNLKRDDIIHELMIKGIDTRPFFYPITVMNPYQKESLPRAEELSRKGLSLPSSLSLDFEDISKITDALKNVR
jgi:perosamine synthetase